MVQALKYFAEHPEAGLVTGNIVQAAEDGTIFNRDTPKMAFEGLLNPWRTESRVNQPGTLFRRAVFERHIDQVLILKRAEFFRRAT